MMKNYQVKKYLWQGIVGCCMMAVLIACSDKIDVPTLPEQPGEAIPQGVPLSESQLFGVWGASQSYGNTASNHFEQRYEIAFQDVSDGEAVFSHWYTNATTENQDSLVGVEYTYTFDGSTIVMTPKKSYAARGVSALRGIHTGNNRIVLVAEDSRQVICTLNRTGDPKPSITSVDRTLPQAGEVVTITGRNLQFVDHIFLPTTTGEIEVTDFTPGSKQIKMVVPAADYAPGSIRCQSTTSHVSCFSPAYMFCNDCIFFHNFLLSGNRPYVGTEFEYTISGLTQTMISKSKSISATAIPAGHCLENVTDITNPDMFLSIFGNTPVAWPVSTKTDNTGYGYIRFSSGDRFQYVLDHCNGLLNKRTACADVAIQMDIYVYSNGQPVWNTGYVQYRLNKDQNSLTSAMVASVAGWEADAPMSFTDGWHTFTIPLSAFPVTKGGSTATLGNLIATLKGSNLQTILTIVNYPLDAAHPAQALDTFQFNIANIRLVPYRTPANRVEN